MLLSQLVCRRPVGGRHALRATRAAVTVGQVVRMATGGKPGLVIAERLSRLAHALPRLVAVLVPVVAGGVAGATAETAAEAATAPA